MRFNYRNSHRINFLNITALSNSSVAVGIHDLSVALPALRYPITALAELRGLEADKLRLGLGLEQMAVPDADEDVVTLGARAVINLLEKQQLSPKAIGRLYLGTESAVDGAKPTATYIAKLVEDWFEPAYGQRSLQHCDVVDMTFACIGAIDALQNAIDWVLAGGLAAQRQAIVVASDTARYQQHSTGEYTQGAGAVAVLVRHEPGLLTFDPHWGVGMEGVHDFYKPLRPIHKKELLQQVLEAADSEASVEEVWTKMQAAHPSDFTTPDVYFQGHDDTPLFDGQYSNQCYTDRMEEALAHYASQAGTSIAQLLLEEWKGLVFHLPYAFHGKRMLSGTYTRAIADAGLWETYFGHEATSEGAEKWVAKSEPYKQFVKDKIDAGQLASQQVGNVYTGSIFLALASWLYHAPAHLPEGSRLGGIAYGSGSKSKVFSMQLASHWQATAKAFGLDALLANRTEISTAQYLQLHSGAAEKAVVGGKAIQFAGQKREEPARLSRIYNIQRP